MIKSIFNIALPYNSFVFVEGNLSAGGNITRDSDFFIQKVIQEVRDKVRDSLVSRWLFFFSIGIEVIPWLIYSFGISNDMYISVNYLEICIVEEF